MRAALSIVEPPRAAPVPAESGRPAPQLAPHRNGAPWRSGEGGFRFWACAAGRDGRSRTTAVWGLWLDHEVVFAADTESIAAGDPQVFPTCVVQLDDDGAVKVVDGSAARVDDPALLARFVSECEAKYGFEPDPGDPDTPVYVVRPGRLDPEHLDRA